MLDLDYLTLFNERRPNEDKNFLGHFKHKQNHMVSV